MIILRKKSNKGQSRGFIQVPAFQKKSGAGFTLIEILVSTTIFAIVSAALMSLFNYTLQINRRAEVLRQATQGMRSFMEYLVKEIRNGQVDYFVINGQVLGTSILPCERPTDVGYDTYVGAKQNKVGIISPEGIEECFYLGDQNGDYVLPNIYSNPNGTLVLERSDGMKRILNPQNFRVENLMFVIVPQKDPYTYTGGLVEVQPSVTIFAKFVAELPTGEIYPIYYQTSVSTNKYDVPRE